jgi:hypothetical protein
MADVCAAKNKHYRKYSMKNLLEEADLAALLTAHRESKRVILNTPSECGCLLCN